ncbi:type I-E CRISPR-associated protein Cse1/CasA [Streptomyces hygroscopicus subsp. sporocinereus]|uniref:Type I-E CRISPR-associated protein Cse1/CasA n=1 Tax=Streptomyces hygroscopicus TaxID=1912 RepID=A0ABQ3U0S9_STRHY|nr:type I-E CRISPR-associated protein Cse1/CasA [Streptomyces hygroscopicus]GHJ28823.1 type I-E CRISPR-associated protein Cse1/CasA [Streptomyces hygroscopicus]
MTDLASTGGGPPSFDLTSQPWIPVLYRDGRQDELSLREVFAQASDVARIVGDVPTQEFALLRLLLAVAHDALDGPRDADQWADWWEDEDCFAPVPSYLDAHRERFDLLHPVAPFFQVAGLRTSRDEVFSLNRIVADVPNGEPFFTARMPSVERLGFAEAARWVVHAHAYDTSGIKTGVVGDGRAKNGKVYPLGVGWAGNLGGVFAEGDTLRETLLLNMVARHTNRHRSDPDDRPAWRREPCGPGAAPDRRPRGVRDLYTWQGRRLRLHFDSDGVYGVVLSYGDPLPLHNLHEREPMTVWRRSATQEKKLGEPQVYMPKGHNPERAVWRGLSSLLAERPTASQTTEAAPELGAAVLEWIAQLATAEGYLPRGTRFRARIVGAVYGTQQSVIDEIVDDRLSIAVILLNRQDRRYAQQAVSAVDDADEAVAVLGDLAVDLARASGAATEGPRSRAREQGYDALDAPYRSWLQNLGGAADPEEHRTRWRAEAHRIIRRIGEQLIAGAGDAAWQGRTITTGKGELWLNSAYAERSFRYRLARVLGDPECLKADTAAPESPGDGPADLGPETPAAEAERVTA